MSRIITLLTDFGTADGYVGEMKGVLATGAAGASLVDIAHDLAPHDVEGARLALARYWRKFPPGTVHVVVIDPGVGGDRTALAVESEARFLVGPDNGVLSPALLHAGTRCVSLPVPPGASPTFHGRDVFAPAAAELAQGIALDALGEPFGEPVIRRTPEATRRDDGSVAGVVITLDRFGNAVTNLMARRGGVLVVGGRRLPLARAYGDVDTGSLVALVGSSGLVEIALRDGSAAAYLGLARGSAVVLLPAT
ncbi:MAG TPA: SAM-dependent chlorinase/fluorinase [Gemmatimonadaceae bacterium]|nr:SAM-dependent chlorinase/fluorinase [Gemmatimonadaceae bacterium]